MELTKSSRIASIDILRGLIMIIMALDHTRDFFHQPALISDPLNANITTIPMYFTRWITHFCAPTFVFLSGASAYLSALKKTPKEASLFLIKRGLWLVLVELTIITFGITFNPYFNFIVFQVIWAIGWSMIILGLLVRISYKLILAAGLLLFFGHNILDFFRLPRTGVDGTLWTIFFRASNSVIPLGPDRIILDLYAILPWTGAMLLGYCAGYWFRKDFPAEKRRKNLLWIGTGFIVLFILLRVTNVYGNPTPWTGGHGFVHDLMTFLNTSKYPPSLQYLCMTLGPSCIVLVLFERVQGKLFDIFSVYGKVPFFYYILHFYLLHIICVVIFYATGHTDSQIAEPGSFLFFRPQNFGFTLPVVYLIWLSVVAALYFPCKWFSGYKQVNRQWWLSYV